MWPQYNRRLRDVVTDLTDEQLAIRPSPELLPIWATVGHTAAMRVYWLCDVVGEPGGETTPFWQEGSAVDWADDLDRPRSADELATGLDSSFAIVEGCLDRWTMDMLSDEIERSYLDVVQVHTRSSIPSACSPTTPGTPASFRRRSVSTVCPSRISGVPTD
jgi:hypothetical protein